jgi:lysophospholipase L1-like esterase
MYMNKGNLLRTIWLAIFGLLHTVNILAQQIRTPVFKDGDRVCFVGNSITNNSLFYNFVNLFYATRYPEQKVTFINCGISGDVTQGVLNRMDSDILVHNPTVSVLMIGMNDVSRGLYAKSRQNEPGIEDKRKQVLDVYRRNLEIIVPKLLENGRKLILQKPSIYDQTADLPAENFIGVNDALKICADYTQILADKYHLPVVDYWTILSDVNKSIQKKNPTGTIIGPDRVHPAGPGHLIMAYEFLKSTGAAEFVSKVSVTRSTKKSNRQSIGCRLSNIDFNKSRIQFSVLENSLPFPVADDAISALDLIPFTDTFNKEILQVSNIAPGTYQLLIDDTKIGVYDAADLKEGINLALVKNTPQYKQALRIMDLYTEYRKTQQMYRNIVTMEIHQVPDSLKNASQDAREVYLNKRLEEKYNGHPQYPYYKGQFKAYLANKIQEKDIRNKIPEIIETVYRLNKPITHTFTLEKQ